MLLTGVWIYHYLHAIVTAQTVSRGADFGKSGDLLRFRYAITSIETYTVGCIVSDSGMAIILI